jgi:hypothetical protein
VQADQAVVHKTTAVVMVFHHTHVTVVQHHKVYVCVQVAAKAEHHAAGQLLVVTITALLTFAVVHVTMTLQFAEHKVQRTNHGADMMHGTICHQDHISETAVVCREHIAVNRGWVVT